jgi:Transposase DDE domain
VWKGVLAAKVFSRWDADPSGSQADKLRERARKHHKVSASKRRQLDWLLVLTNVAVCMLSAQQVVALMRLRWQIELFWKLCKQEGKIDTWRSSKPQRILTELYAKLLGLLMEHWITLQGCWHDPRRSLFKARQVIEWTAPWLVLALRGHVAWEVVLAAMCATMGSNCWTDRRHKPPSTFQQLADPQLSSS